MKTLSFLLSILCVLSCSKNILYAQKQVDSSHYKSMMIIAAEDFVANNLNDLTHGHHIEFNLDEVVFSMNENGYSNAILPSRKLDTSVISGLKVEEWSGKIGTYNLSFFKGRRDKMAKRVLSMIFSSPYYIKGEGEIELYLVTVYRNSYKHFYYRFNFDEKGDLVFLYSKKFGVRH